MASVIEIVQAREPEGIAWENDSRFSSRVSLAQQRVNTFQFGSRTNEAVALIVMHWYAKDHISNIVGARLGGALSATSVGGQSISMLNESKDDYSATDYGKEYIDLRDSCVIGIII